MHLVANQVKFAHPNCPPVLNGVNLAVRVGQSVAIVGPSGSGKTTLLALLGGLLRPAEGTISYQDQDQDQDQEHLHPVADHVSWVLQTVNVMPDRTVLDNVAVGAFSDGAPRAEAVERAERALVTVGLAGTGQRPVRTLSGGEAQRVVIARAAVSDRPVLLADEPTGQLDQNTSARVIDALLTSAANKITVVVTHDPAVAARCTRTLTLGAGVLSEAR